MKLKTTQKFIKENYNNIICVGYCNLQDLLCYNNANYYTTRAEGWGCDIYEIDYHTCISTGYAPFGNIKANYDITRKYEQQAQKILYSRKYKKFETKKKKLNELLEQFINEVVKA